MLQAASYMKSRKNNGHISEWEDYKSMFSLSETCVFPISLS